MWPRCNTLYISTYYYDLHSTDYKDKSFAKTVVSIHWNFFTYRLAAAYQ